MLDSKSTPVDTANFTIKLLSGNNVVLVESTGLESELFMPTIMNGRIYIQNIIPNRRCCRQLRKKNPNPRHLLTEPFRLTEEAIAAQYQVKKQDTTRRLFGGGDTQNKSQIEKQLHTKPHASILNDCHKIVPDKTSHISELNRMFKNVVVPTPKQVVNNTFCKMTNYKDLRPQSTSATPKNSSKSLGEIKLLPKISAKKIGTPLTGTAEVKDTNIKSTSRSNTALNTTEVFCVRKVGNSTAPNLTQLETVPKWRKLATPKGTHSKYSITTKKPKKSKLSAKKKSTTATMDTGATSGMKAADSLLVRKRKSQKLSTSQKSSSGVLNGFNQTDRTNLKTMRSSASNKNPDYKLVATIPATKTHGPCRVLVCNQTASTSSSSLRDTPKVKTHSKTTL